MADDDKKNPAPPQKPIEKRKEKKPAVDPTIGSIDKGVQDANKNLDALIQRSGQVSNRAEQRADLLLQAADAQKKIDELAANGREKEAKEMQATLDETQKLLKGSKTDIAIGNRLAELATINSDTSDLIQKYGSKEEQATKENLSSLQNVIKRIEKQTKITEGDTLNQDLGRQLKKLGGKFGQFSTMQTKALQKAYDDAQKNLALPMNEDNKKLILAAREQIEEIKKGAESEENRREAQKLNEEANSRLARIGNAMESFGQKFDDVAMAGAKGAGFLAGLTGLALLFLDPETFQAIMTSIIEKASIVFDTIYALVSGDFDKAGELFGENMGLFGSLIGSIAFLFMGRFIKVIGTALKAARVFKVFMMGTFIPTLSAMFGAITTAVTPIVAAMAPILVPVLAIMALVGGLYYGFKKLQDSLGPGASIMDTLKVAMLYFIDFLAMIVNGITYIPRKLIGFLGKRAAKWIMGDDFDTSALDAISEGFDTGRGARAAAEIKAKNEAAAAEEAAKSPEEEFVMPTAMTQEELMAQVNAKTTVDGEAISQSSADLQADQATTASNINVSTVTSTPTTTNNQVIQSNVTHMLPSAASAVLGGASSR